MPSNTSALREAVSKTMVEYFQKTSLNGFGLLYYIRRRKYQRIFWFVFIALGIGFAVYIVGHTLCAMLSQPTVTVLDTQRRSVWSTPFPAVAVCSTNKLSLRAVKQYAYHMAKHSLEYKSSDYWLHKLRLFIGFFDSDAVDSAEALELQKQLDSMQPDEFNVTNILGRLAPNCRELLLECFWAGKSKECGELFRMHAIPAGNCCIFNYQQKTIVDKINDLEDSKAERSLKILLNVSTTDYFCMEGSSSGLKLFIFGLQRFPDLTSGSVQELHVNGGESIDVRLSLVSQVATKWTRKYAVEKRGCYFADEQNTGTYDQAECLTVCKLERVKAFCGCVPFYAFDHNARNTTKLRECNLAHVECLQHYRELWQTSQLPKELKGPLSCRQCLPSCSYDRYYYRKSMTKLTNSRILGFRKNLIGKYDHAIRDISIVHLYFPLTPTTHFEKNVLYTWYQILSNIGGVIGICMGCSIISGFEILYFSSFRLMENYLNCRKKRT